MYVNFNVHEKKRSKEKMRIKEGGGFPRKPPKIFWRKLTLEALLVFLIN